MLTPLVDRYSSSGSGGAGASHNNAPLYPSYTDYTPYLQHVPVPEERRYSSQSNSSFILPPLLSSSSSTFDRGGSGLIQLPPLIRAALRSPHEEQTYPYPDRILPAIGENYTLQQQNRSSLPSGHSRHLSGESNWSQPQSHQNLSQGYRPLSGISEQLGVRSDYPFAFAHHQQQQPGGSLYLGSSPLHSPLSAYNIPNDHPLNNYPQDDLYNEMPPRRSTNLAGMGSTPIPLSSGGLNGSPILPPAGPATRARTTRAMASQNLLQQESGGPRASVLSIRSSLQRGGTGFSAGFGGGGGGGDYMNGGTSGNGGGYAVPGPSVAATGSVGRQIRPLAGRGAVRQYPSSSSVVQPGSRQSTAMSMNAPSITGNGSGYGGNTAGGYQTRSQQAIGYTNGSGSGSGTARAYQPYNQEGHHSQASGSSRNSQGNGHGYAQKGYFTDLHGKERSIIDLVESGDEASQPPPPPPQQPIHSQESYTGVSTRAGTKRKAPVASSSGTTTTNNNASGSSTVGAKKRRVEEGSYGSSSAWGHEGNNYRGSESVAASASGDGRRNANASGSRVNGTAGTSTSANTQSTLNTAVGIAATEQAIARQTKPAASRGRAAQQAHVLPPSNYPPVLPLPPPELGGFGVDGWDDREGHYVVKPGHLFGPGDHYQIVRLLGQGTFGKVLEAKEAYSTRRVAIKVIKAVQKYRDASKIEIRVLKTLKKYDPENRFNCIHLLGEFDFRNHICLVSELLGQSVFDFLKENKFQPFPEAHIQDFAKSLLHSLSYVHSLKLTHTDLKPENILLVNHAYTDLGERTRGKNHRHILKNTDIRLIDFGSATFEHEFHSSVVCTRHYRAPEIILGLSWSYPCDLFSIGCILVEFYTGNALFQTHDNLEHLAMMEIVMGPMPAAMARKGAKVNGSLFRGTKVDWPNAAVTRQSKKFVTAMKPLNRVVENSSSRNNTLRAEFLDLIKRLLAFDPDHRITVGQASQHPYLKILPPPPPTADDVKANGGSVGNGLRGCPLTPKAAKA